MARDPELELLIENLRKAGINQTMTAEQAARATYDAIAKTVKAVGQDPAWECFIKAPGEPRHFDDDRCWVVAWEAGPYQWGVTVSCSDIFPHLVEPYYSFDLTFYDVEWGVTEKGRKVRLQGTRETRKDRKPVDYSRTFDTYVIAKDVLDAERIARDNWRDQWTDIVFVNSQEVER